MESVKEETTKKITQEELKGDAKEADEDEEEDPTVATTDAVI